MSSRLQLQGTITDGNGHSADGYADVQVFAVPTCVVERVGTGPVYVGDQVTVKVTGTTDPDAGSAVSSLKVNGQAVQASTDGLFRFTAQ